MPNGSIKVYALSTCIHCKKAKEFLDANNIEYDCTYVDRLTGDERTETVNMIKKLNPSLSFPTIVIGERVVVGFNEDDLKEALDM